MEKDICVCALSERNWTTSIETIVTSRCSINKYALKHIAVGSTFPSRTCICLSVSNFTRHLLLRYTSYLDGLPIQMSSTHHPHSLSIMCFCVEDMARQHTQRLVVYEHARTLNLLERRADVCWLFALGGGKITNPIYVIVS